MQDIAPQLLEAVSKAFQQNLNKNKKIKDLQKKLLSAKDLKGNEAELYAVEVGEALAKAFHDEINAHTLPDGRMYYNIASRVIPPPLQKVYEDVADYAEAMYQGMNERAKLGIKAQRAKYSTDREKGLIEYACGSDDYSNRQKNFEGSLVNYAQSVATDTMKENAEFQYQAGLSPVIRRSANGGCCEWCAALAGVYPYEEIRATGSDVYRRHRDCRCTVTYDPGDGKVQNVHTKRWESMDPKSLKSRSIHVESNAGNDIILARGGGVNSSAKRIPNPVERARIIREAIQATEPVYAEDLRKAYRAVAKKSDLYDVVVHGAPEYVEYEKTYRFGAETLAYIISGRKDYKGHDIRLIACSAGKVNQKGYCLAQELSNRLNVNVYAADDVVNIHSDGRLTVGRNKVSYEEAAIRFTPRK